MLGRTHRFHGRKALNGVYKRGRTARAPMLSLRYTVRGSGKPYRVAVVVSRKVNRSAVVAQPHQAPDICRRQRGDCRT